MNEKTTYMFSETRVNQGGVMRCCLQTLRGSHKADDTVTEGLAIQCKHCDKSLILDAGIWGRQQ